MNKNFYILLIYFILFHFSNVYSQGTWESINSPTDKFLRCVFFTDSLYGWAVGDSGSIIHTSNGGQGWTVQNSNTTNNIVEVFFLNRLQGWAASWNVYNYPFGTQILKTTDGGENWITDNYPDENIFIQCIFYTDSLNGWMGGKPHALVRTSNGGISWQQAQIDSALFAFFPVLSLKFFDDQIGFASGGAFEAAGVMWRTTNGGNNWSVIDPLEAPPDPIHEFQIIDSLKIIGVGGDFEIFGVSTTSSSDGGLSWQNENLGIQGVAIDIESRSDNEIWITLGAQRSFIYSLDTCSSWVQISTPDSAAIYDIVFPDTLHGFAVGKQGTILKYTPPIIDEVTTKFRNVTTDYYLFQNYPNPFNLITNILFTIPLNMANSEAVSYREPLKVSLKIYDVIGKEVVMLLNEEKFSGTYEYNFNASSLTSGVYFYKLQAGSFIQTKKMILLK